MNWGWWLAHKCYVPDSISIFSYVWSCSFPQAHRSRCLAHQRPQRRQNRGSHCYVYFSCLRYGTVYLTTQFLACHPGLVFWNSSRPRPEFAAWAATGDFCKKHHLLGLNPLCPNSIRVSVVLDTSRSVLDNQKICTFLLKTKISIRQLSLIAPGCSNLTPPANHNKLMRFNFFAQLKIR